MKREQPTGSFSSRFQEETGTGVSVDATNTMNRCNMDTLTYTVSTKEYGKSGLRLETSDVNRLPVTR